MRNAFFKVHARLTHLKFGTNKETNHWLPIYSSISKMGAVKCRMLFHYLIVLLIIVVNGPVLLRKC